MARRPEAVASAQELEGENMFGPTLGQLLNAITGGGLALIGQGLYDTVVGLTTAVFGGLTFLLSL
jgi:hypothetical protein